MFLCDAAIRQIKQDRVKCVHVDTGGVPHRVEVTGLIFGGHETPLDPHALTASSSEEAERVGER